MNSLDQRVEKRDRVSRGITARCLHTVGVAPAIGVCPHRLFEATDFRREKAKKEGKKAFRTQTRAGSGAI